jgi:HAE1 family hydrophobic/amphiphilic exporter-1
MMIQPIGLTVIGGLASSTLITLFFIPVLYSYINEHRGRKHKRISRILSNTKPLADTEEI